MVPNLRMVSAGFTELERVNGEIMPDQTRTCIEDECGKAFIITEKEAAWFQSRIPPMSLPKRCSECRARRKKEREIEERHE